MTLGKELRNQKLDARKLSLDITQSGCLGLWDGERTLSHGTQEEISKATTLYKTFYLFYAILERINSLDILRNLNST